MANETMKVKIGNLVIGGGNQVAIQSMLSIRAEDVRGNVEQAIRLEKAGCQIIRVAIPNKEAVILIDKIKNEVSIPVVADIHFDYKLALACADAGVDKIRINPGNIGDSDRVRAVALACNQKNIPIRIGVNSGSLEKHILEKYQGPTPEALVESAVYHASLLEKADFNNIVISLKSSDLKTMISAYRLAAKELCYPLHLGVTEAGTKRMGIVKSAIGIGSLLCDGIGDTIRVSLTDDPIEEISAAKDILKAIGAKGCGPQLISCPTCGRTQIDVIGMAKKVEERLKYIDKDIKVAVMGCIVNGPGEASEADFGIAGGQGCGIIFSKGKIIGKYDEKDLLDQLFSRIEGARDE